MSGLTAREAAALVRTIEDLEAKLRDCAAGRQEAEQRAEEAEERAERIKRDMQLQDQELKAKRRQIADHARTRNARRQVSSRKDDIEYVFRAWHDEIVERNPKREKAMLGERRWKAIEKALEAGHDRELLASAVAALVREPWVIEGSAYDDIPHALLNRAGHVDEVKIERLAGAADAAPAQPQAPVVIRPAGDGAGPVRPGWAPAGPVFPMFDFKLTRLERATAALADEFGSDAVDRVWNEKTGRVDMAWATCPLEPSEGGHPLCLLDAPEGSTVHLVCAHGHPYEELLGAVQELERRHEGRWERAKAAAELCRLVHAEVLAEGLKRVDELEEAAAV